MFALPGGFVGTMTTWFVTRNRRRVDDTENLLDTLKRQSDDISNLYRELGAIRRAIEKRNFCRYLPVCPVDVELRRAKGYKVNNPVQRERQRDGTGNYNLEACDGTTISGIPPPERDADRAITTGSDVPG